MFHRYHSCHCQQLITYPRVWRREDEAWQREERIVYETVIESSVHCPDGNGGIPGPSGCLMCSAHAVVCPARAVFAGGGRDNSRYRCARRRARGNGHWHLYRIENGLHRIVAGGEP